MDSSYQPGAEIGLELGIGADTGTYCAEYASTGSESTRVFQMLSGGKTGQAPIVAMQPPMRRQETRRNQRSIDFKSLRMAASQGICFPCGTSGIPADVATCPPSRMFAEAGCATRHFGDIHLSADQFLPAISSLVRVR